VRVTDTVPLGAGLSSSAALEAAVGLAACELYGVDVPRVELAAACVRAENEIVGAQTGGMDQACVLLARAGHALLLDTRDVSTGTSRSPRRRRPRRAGDRHQGAPRARRRAVRQAPRRRRGRAVTLGAPSLRDLTVDDLRASDADLSPARATSSPRSRASARSWRCSTPGGWPTSARCSTPRTARCATTTRCRAGSWTWPWTRPRRRALGARMTGGGFGGIGDRAGAGRPDRRRRRGRPRRVRPGGLAEPDVRTAEPSAAAERLG
jgi:galactokinase